MAIVREQCYNTKDIYLNAYLGSDRELKKANGSHIIHTIV
jgi:hypothetical protein